MNNNNFTKNIKKINAKSKVKFGSKYLNNNNNCKNINKKKKSQIFKVKNETNKKSTIKSSSPKFNDYELNSFDYNNAISYDKRTCCQYYLSLLKVKNIIIFSFYPKKDYNSMIIKTCIFSLSFSIYCATNFVFFDDNIMHKIYEVEGKYDVLYFIPIIAISFGVSYYFTIIIKIIFLSERNIAQVRMQKNLSEAYYIAYKVRKNLII